MRFLIAMYASPRVPPPTQQPDAEWMRAMIAFMKQIDVDLRESGELVADAGFDRPGFTVTADAVAREPLSDGSPLIGFWLVDVASEERAVEIGRSIAHWSGAVEVRPVGAPPEL